jgi:hypothetical protein
LPLHHLHLGVESLADAVVAGEAPHGGHLFLPRVECLAEGDPWRGAGPRKALMALSRRGCGGGLFAGAVLL